MPTNIEQTKKQITELQAKIREILENKLNIDNKELSAVQYASFFMDFARYCKSPDKNATYNAFTSLSDREITNNTNEFTKVRGNTLLREFKHYLAHLAQALDDVINGKSGELPSDDPDISSISLHELIKNLEETLSKQPNPSGVQQSKEKQTVQERIKAIGVKKINDHLAVVKSILMPYIEATELLSKSSHPMIDDTEDKFTLEVGLKTVAEQLTELSKNEPALKVLVDNLKDNDKIDKNCVMIDRDYYRASKNFDVIFASNNDPSIAKEAPENSSGVTGEKTQTVKVKSKIVAISASALFKKASGAENAFVQPLALLEDAVGLLTRLQAEGIAFVITRDAAEQNRIMQKGETEAIASEQLIWGTGVIQKTLTEHGITIASDGDIIYGPNHLVIASAITAKANKADILYVHTAPAELIGQGFSAIQVTQNIERSGKIKTTGYQRAFSFAKNNELVVIDWDDTLAKGVAYEAIRFHLEELHKQGARIAIVSAITKPADIISALRRNLIEGIEERDIISPFEYKENLKTGKTKLVKVEDFTVATGIENYINQINPDKVTMAISYYEDGVNNKLSTIPKIAGHSVKASELIKDGDYSNLTKNATVGAGAAKIAGSFFTLIAAAAGFFIPFVGPAVTAGFVVLAIGLLANGIHEIRTAVKNNNLEKLVEAKKNEVVVPEAGEASSSRQSTNQPELPGVYPSPIPTRSSTQQQRSGSLAIPAATTPSVVPLRKSL